MSGLGESMEEKQYGKFPDSKKGGTERFIMPSYVKEQQTIKRQYRQYRRWIIKNKKMQ